MTASGNVNMESAQPERWNDRREVTAKKSRVGKKSTRQTGHGTRASPLPYLSTEAFKGSEAEWSKEQNKKGWMRGEGKQKRSSSSAAVNGCVDGSHGVHRLESEEAKPFLASSV